jgi:hypothetical protein
MIDITSARYLKCIKLFQHVGIEVDNLSMISSASLDKMKLHILECLNVLSPVEELLKEIKQGVLSVSDIIDLYKKFEFAKDIVFKGAINIILTENSKYKRNADIIQNFSGVTKINDSDDWLPLHWALAIGYTVTDEVVKDVFMADPMALTKCHMK